MATKSDLITSASLVNTPMMSVKLDGKSYVYCELGGLYHLDLTPISLPRALRSLISALQWYCPLGHPSLSTLKHQVLSLSQVPSLHCEPCQLSKHDRVSFPSRVVNRISSPFELVQSDVWGPINVTSNKFHYFVTFVDDFSHMKWLILI
jgi:hypothetical protein